MNIFNVNSSFYQFLTKIMELMILNIMWLVSSLPLFTIGASTTALYVVLSREDERESLPCAFWSAFRKNFRASLPITAVMAILAVVAWTAYLIFLAGDMSKPHFSDIFPALIIVMYFCIRSYVWKLHASFENSAQQPLQNALLLSLAYLPRSLLIAVINMVPVVWLLYATSSFVKFLMFWVLIGIALIVNLTNRLISPILSKQMQVPHEDGTNDYIDMLREEYKDSE